MAGAAPPKSPPPAAPRPNKPIAHAWQQFVRHDQWALSVLALLIGAIAAYGAIGFRLAIDATQYFFYGSGSEMVIAMAQDLAWWHRLLAPAAGGLLIGIAVYRLLPEQRPQGVAEVIEACAIKNGRMRLRDGIAAAAVSATSIGAGASVGREGPVVHLAATMASSVAGRLGLGRAHTLTLVGCGVASGVAASFNAPIAGVFFALEVVVGHYALGTFAPVVIAGVIGTIVARIHLGNFPAFIVPGAEIVTFAELPAYFLLGVLCAAVAASMMAGIVLVGETVKRVRVPAYFYPAAGGLLVGAIAAFVPEVIGVGYETTDQALSGGYGLWLLVGLVIAKTAATCISLGSGFGGGVFSPSLCIGALTGAAFGLVAAAIVPETGVSVNSYSIVGMGAVAGAVLGAPISTILIIFELTGDYTLTIAVMAAVTVSSLIVRQTLYHSFFTWQLARRGVDLARGQERAICRSIPIGTLVSDQFHALDESASLKQIRDLVRTAPQTDFYVIDSDNRLQGVLLFRSMRGALFDPAASADLTAKDLRATVDAVLDISDDLDRALAHFGGTEHQHLPVVDRQNDDRLVGVLYHRAVIEAYNKVLQQLRAEERGQR